MQFTVVRMMYCAAFATFLLLGVASAQSDLKLTACVNKEQNLEMFCKFTPVSDPKLTICYYKVKSVVVGSTDSTLSPDKTYQNRATVYIEENTCKLLLKGFSDDKPQNYTCYIKQSVEPLAITSLVDKSKLQTCSAWCVMQHSGVALLLAFLTFPLLSELL